MADVENLAVVALRTGRQVDHELVATPPIVGDRIPRRRSGVGLQPSHRGGHPHLGGGRIRGYFSTVEHARHPGDGRKHKVPGEGGCDAERDGWMWQRWPAI